MINLHADIAVFAFNRPYHLSKTLKALAACPESKESRLTIYCDGPRHTGDLDLHDEVFKIASDAKGFKSVSVIRHSKNLGLARSMINGITSQLLDNQRIIILEDDIIVAPFFLKFMNEALDMYAQDDQVASIHGYLYPVDEVLPETFFMRGTDCWGWATWDRAWKYFREDGLELLAELRERDLIDKFDLSGAYPFSLMLKDQAFGRNDSWAIRWHASCFLRNMLTLYPARSLVKNIGNDNSGTHCGASDSHNIDLSATPIDLKRIALIESTIGRNAVERFYRRIHGFSFNRVVQKIKNMYSKIVT